MTKKGSIDPVEFMRIRLEGCRKGGLKSAGVRKERSRRIDIELAILDLKTKGKYSHNSAAQLASGLKTTAHYVRKLARQIENKRT